MAMGDGTVWAVIENGGRRFAVSSGLEPIMRWAAKDKGARVVALHAGSCGLGMVAGGIVGMPSNAGTCTCTPRNVAVVR